MDLNSRKRKGSGGWSSGVQNKSLHARQMQSARSAFVISQYILRSVELCSQCRDEHLWCGLLPGPPSMVRCVQRPVAVLQGRRCAV